MISKVELRHFLQLEPKVNFQLHQARLQAPVSDDDLHNTVSRVLLKLNLQV